MNFRAIDPRDARKGLVAGAEVDRSVWDKFYDRDAKSVRTAELEAEFTRLWPIGSERDPDTTTLEEITKVTAGRGGQGFVSDPAIRKAVEQRAMDLAMEHYGRLFARVDTTATTHPYDLRCFDKELEIHVEVKGSTGDASEIRLTIGEVENARATRWRTELFLPSNIRVTPGPDGPHADGGETRTIERWTPDSEDMKALVFRYRVPSSPGGSRYLGTGGGNA
jgi:hypothetical protein